MSRAKLRIKTGDEVIVIAGKDKGKTGRVVRVLPERHQVIVEGVRRVRRHQRPVGDQPGGIIEKEMPVHLSNVGIYNPATGRADRVGIKTLEDGRKVRFFKSNGETIDI